jgi:hypothetical protein
LVPLSKINRDIRRDIIPENPKHNLISTLIETLNLVIPQKLSHAKNIKDLNSLAQKATVISKLEHISSEPLFIYRIEVHITLIYVTIIMFLLVVSVLAIKFRHKIIKMYSPEVADNQSNISQENP